MSRLKRGSTVAAFGAAVLLAAAPAPAGAAEAFRPRISTQTDQVGGRVTATVTVNEEPAAVLQVTTGGHGPAVRAALVADRLQALVANGLAPGEIGAGRVAGKAWAVTARQASLLLVTPQEAAAHHTSPEALARSWAGTLRRLLAEPPLSLSQPGLTVPFGETRTVKVGGPALTPQLVAQDSDVRVSQTRYDPASHTLTVRGLMPGRAAVNLQSGEASTSLPVVVMKYAARVDPNITVSVTGTPSAPPDMVMRAVYAGLARAVDAEPGAQLHMDAEPHFGQSLASGAHVTAALPLRVAGPDLLPVQTTATITVLNNPLELRPAAALFYSNNPEQIKSGQSLFTGRLPQSEPVRLDYHHQNISGEPLVFHADVINESAMPASVHVMSGVSLPGADTVQVGRRAGVAFLQALDAGVGLVLRVPPHARVPIVTQPFAPGLTVSGIVQLQQVEGPMDSLTVQVSADGDHSSLASPVARVILAALPDSRSTPLPDQPTEYGTSVSLPPVSPYVFAAPEIRRAETYRVGGKWTYIRIGHTEALKNSTGRLTLWGNYGADYLIALTLSNPTSAPRPVGIYFAPEAGLSAGVFRVDGGALIEFDPTPPPQEPLIARYTLAPGETRRVRLETIPLNGSSYPLSILVHAL